MLHALLNDRKAINTLKTLVEKDEVISLKAVRLSPRSAHLLAREGLLHYDVREDMISASAKGKQFIALFDEVKSLVEQPTTGKRVQLDISLTSTEQRLLLLLSRMETPPTFDTLLAKAKAVGLFRNQKTFKQTLETLQELHFITLDKEVTLTTVGKKRLREHLLTAFRLEE